MRKQTQLNRILKSNPMKDIHHTGIRSVKDIKTFRQVVKTQGNEEYSYPDFNLNDAKLAIKKGTIVVHSSKPIKVGNFVATSWRNAKDYAGSNKVYSKRVKLGAVAWINTDEGQYTGNSKKRSKN